MRSSSCASSADLARVEAGGRLVEAEQHAARCTSRARSRAGAGRRRAGCRRSSRRASVRPMRVEPVRARARPPRASACAVAGEAEQRRARCSRTPASACCAARRSGSPARSLAEQADVLEGARERLRARSGSRPSARAAARAVVAVEGELADGRLVEAGQAVEHRGLAGAVRADDRGDLALVRGERRGRRPRPGRRSAWSGARPRAAARRGSWPLGLPAAPAGDAAGWSARGGRAGRAAARP